MASLCEFANACTTHRAFSNPLCSLPLEMYNLNNLLPIAISIRDAFHAFITGCATAPLFVAGSRSKRLLFEQGKFRLGAGAVIRVEVLISRQIFLERSLHSTFSFRNSAPRCREKAFRGKPPCGSCPVFMFPVQDHNIAIKILISPSQVPFPLAFIVAAPSLSISIQDSVALKPFSESNNWLTRKW